MLVVTSKTFSPQTNLTIFSVDRVLVRIPVHVGNVHRAKTVYDKIAAGKPVQHDGQRAANAAAHSAARGRRHGPRGPDRTRWRARHGHFARVLRVGNGWPPGGPHRADGRENAWRGRPIIVRPFRGQRGPDRAFGRDDGDTLAAHTTAVRERDNGTTAPDHAADGTSSSPHAVGNVYYTLDPVVPYA